MLQGLEEGPDDGLLVHKSPKLQMIDDPKVVITQYAVSAVVIIYFLFNIFQNFGYMKLETPYGSTNMWAGGYDASNDAGLCLAAGNYDFTYSDAWTYYDNKCRQFTYGEDRAQARGRRFLYTDLRPGHRVDVHGLRRRRDRLPNVSTVKTENYFVPGVENIEISVEHGFTAVQRGVSKLMPKTTVWKKSGDWEGKQDDDDEESFNEKKPFAMTLKEMLKLAGVDSIDAPNHAGAVAGSVGVPTYRMTGMVIELQIDYTNKIPGLLRRERVHRAGVDRQGPDRLGRPGRRHRLHGARDAVGGERGRQLRDLRVLLVRRQDRRRRHGRDRPLRLLLPHGRRDPAPRVLGPRRHRRRVRRVLAAGREVRGLRRRPARRTRTASTTPSRRAASGPRTGRTARAGTRTTSPRRVTPGPSPGASEPSNSPRARATTFNSSRRSEAPGPRSSVGGP